MTAKKDEREFSRWLAEQDQSAWPDKLKVSAERALLTLKSLDQRDVHKSESLMEESRKDLAAFAAAYAEWRA